MPRPRVCLSVLDDILAHGPPAVKHGYVDPETASRPQGRSYNTRRATSGNPDVLGSAPHFEKTPYDNARLARVYLHACQVTGNEFFRTINEELLDYAVRDGYRPFQVMALGAPEAQPPVLPLLQDRGLVEGQPTAYVCRDFVCQAPVTDPLSLKQLLGVN